MTVPGHGGRAATQTGGKPLPTNLQARRRLEGDDPARRQSALSSSFSVSAAPPVLPAPEVVLSTRVDTHAYLAAERGTLGPQDTARWLQSRHQLCFRCLGR
ncbi:unnamed protein product [Rangifer tarandus platyrhynchus]|uniref:Uncharacterized protein n=1 Tax=Rangifer tarandus platyrhynchus TaxID=3082113 RepID=A0AC59ZAT1_RANTA